MLEKSKANSRESLLCSNLLFCGRGKDFRRSVLHGWLGGLVAVFEGLVLLLELVHFIDKIANGRVHRTERTDQ